MRYLFLLMGMLLASAAPGSEQPLAEKVCGAQQQRCTEGCDMDKVLWLYKGEAYGNCMQQCEERGDACLAAELDVDTFEVILARSAYGEREVDDKPSLEEYEIEDGAQ